MEILRNKEEKIMCPYDKVHYVFKRKFEIHLINCRKNFISKNSEIFVTCDFNASHKILEPELQHHHDVCPDRKIFELHVFSEETALPPMVNNFQLPVPADFSLDDRHSNLDPAKTGTPVRSGPGQGPGNPHKSKANNQNFPPTPMFPQGSIERVPQAITDMMKQVSIIPKAAVMQQNKNLKK